MFWHEKSSEEVATKESKAEKPRIPVSNLALMGLYIFKREALIECLTENANDTSSPRDFGYAVIPKMVKKDGGFAYEFNGYWQV